MKTVLGFDSWTGGAHNFARLVPALREKGYDLKLLHIGSWGGDTCRPAEEIIGELIVRDVSYYGGKNLLSILEIEKPSVVLFLSNDVFAHRAFNRYCRLRDVPSIHAYHGLVGIQATEGTKIYKANPINQIGYVLNRVPKALMRVWPLYIDSLIRTRASLTEWFRFLSDIVNLALGKYIRFAASDSKTNACIVYTQTDVHHAQTKYGYATDEVHIVGNPDLGTFGLSEEMLSVGSSGTSDRVNEVIYIDTGLIYAGMVFSGAEDFRLHLTNISYKLADQGLKLAIKLHPDHYRTNFPKEILSCGIRVVANDDFIPTLLKCRAAMVEPSTAALIPALVGLPLLMVSFGKLKDQKYGNILMDYPRASLLTDIEMAMTTIAEIEDRDSSNLKEWIKSNSGPLPAEEMPNRVSEVIKQVIEQ